MNEILKNIEQRHSKRAYLPQAIPREITESVLNAARHAPSSKNTQPWQVAVIEGQNQNALRKLLLQKFDKDQFEKEDYTYSVEPTPSEFKERARACGYGLFELKGIPRRDYEKRRAHNRENFSFFDAPQVMIFHLPLGAERGNFLDMGFFMQNIMLGFESYGISSCPQFSLCSFSQTLREFLDIDRCIVSGLSVGYPDPEAIVNSYVPKRLPLEEFVTWHS